VDDYTFRVDYPLQIVQVLRYAFSVENPNFDKQEFVKIIIKKQKQNVNSRKRRGNNATRRGICAASFFRIFVL